MESPFWRSVWEIKFTKTKTYSPASWRFPCPGRHRTSWQCSRGPHTAWWRPPSGTPLCHSASSPCWDTWPPPAPAHRGSGWSLSAGIQWPVLFCGPTWEHVLTTTNEHKVERGSGGDTRNLKSMIMTHTSNCSSSMPCYSFLKLCDSWQSKSP